MGVADEGVGHFNRHRHAHQPPGRQEQRARAADAAHPHGRDAVQCAGVLHFGAVRLVGGHRQQAAFAQLQPLPAQSTHLQFGGNAGQVQVVGAIHLYCQPGIGTHACAPVQPTRADGQSGTMRSAVRHLVAALVLVARYRGAGLADAVLQLPAQRGAVALVIVAA